MKWPPYPKYKPSGVQWIGEVPEHWEVKRLKYSATINDEALRETTDPDFEMNYVDISSVDATRGIVASEDIVFEDAPSRARRVVRDGDTIVSTIRTYLRAIAPVRNSAGNIIVSTGFAVVRPRTVSPAFLSYALREPGLVEAIVARSGGVSYPAVNASEIGTLPVPLPVEEEQTAIADFLDHETAKLDTLVAKKRTLIERLKEKRTALISRTVTRGLPPDVALAAGIDPHPKLKPSCIDWLGEVPEHWVLPPLYMRYQVDLGKMLNEAAISGDHLVPYLRNVDVQWNRINVSELPEMDIGPWESARYTVRLGDLLVCEGGEVGRAALVGVVAEGLGYQKALHRLRPLKADEEPRFLLFTFYWAVQQGIFVAGGNPNTIPHLTGEKLRAYRFPAPPKFEQRAIADFLDGETATIGCMVAKIETAIERLQEYRAGLITAAVTGKIDVRHQDVREGASDAPASLS